MNASQSSRDSRHCISPAGTHEPDVPALSRLGSHLFGSDGGVGFPSFAPQPPLFGLIPFGVGSVRIRLESDESRTRGCVSLERESGGEHSPQTVWATVERSMLATTGLVCEATDRPSFSVQGSSAWRSLGGAMPVARSLPPIVHQYRGKRERKVRVQRYKCMLSRRQNNLITDRLERFGFSSYSQYLKSELWQRKRQDWYRSRWNKHRCYCCGRKDVPLQLHHKTYKRLGYERLNDLLSLCDECHGGAHELLNEGRADIFTCARKYRKRLHRKWRHGYEPEAGAR